MAAPFPSPAILAEWKGRTRVLFERIRAADARLVPALVQIERPLERRLATHPKLRPEHIHDASRAWQATMPSEFRIALDMEACPVRRPTALRFREHRLPFGVGTRPGWDTPEHSVAVAQLELSTASGRCLVSGHVEALISAHAVGRWFQRARDTSDGALIKDTGALIGQQAETVRTPSGWWFLERTHARDASGARRLVWSVRTYRDAQEISGDAPAVRPIRRRNWVAANPPGLGRKQAV